MSNELRFQDRVVIVTGSGRGIGRAHAELLATRGAAVVVVDPGGDHLGRGRSDGPAAEVAERIRDAGGQAVGTAESVTSAAGAAAIVALAIKEFGRVDALINNAGISESIPFAQIPDVTYRQFLDTHYMGNVFMTRAAWPHLVASGAGRVVNTISGAMLGIPSMVHYGSAKGAVWGFTRTLASEGAPHAVKVNAIAPLAATRLFEPSVSSLPAAVAEQMRSNAPAELVAPVAAYLAHETCELTGETLSVGAGRVARMAMVSSAGFVDQRLTPESVRDRLQDAMDLSQATPITPIIHQSPTGM